MTMTAPVFAKNANLRRAALLLAVFGLLGAAAAGEPPVPPGAGFGTSTEVHPEIWPKGVSGAARDPAIEARVAQILAHMTLEEKVGQLIQADIAYVTPAEVKAYHLGSVLNGGSSGPYGNDKAPPADWLKLADEFYAASPALPPIWGMDAVHGNTNIVGATIFPHNIALGAMHDPALMRKIGEITAKEVRIVGGDWTFAPTVAVARDDRWGRTYESWSEDPALAAAYAREIVLGIQGEPGTPDFLAGAHVIATAKHYLGDGGTDGGRNEGDNLYSEPALRDIFAPPYEAAIAAGVQTVMASHSSWRGERMHGSRGFLTDILVGRLGFDGFTVGDWNGYVRIAGCNREHCPVTLKAGLDMYMAPDGWKALYANTVAEAKSGAIPSARLDEAVARVLRVKLRAHVVGEGKPSARPFAGRFDLLGSPEHRAVARQAVRESLVLLKNENKILPLKPNLHVLVAGDGADDLSKQSGGWTISWQGDGNTRADFPHATTIFEGIRDTVAAAGGSATLGIDGSFAAKPDVAIVVFGEPPYAESRGDRPDVDYQRGARTDLALLRKLKAQGVPVVAVFLSGRPLYVTPEINASDAFVVAWLPGGEGTGVADLLFARADGTPAWDFSGRLSFSWPRAPDQTVLDIGTEPYYPLFAYGYGLGYGAPKNIGQLPEAPGAEAAAADPAVLVADGRAAGAWSFALAGRKGRVALDHAPMEAPGGALRVSRIDRFKQEDTLAAVWNGKGRAALIVQGAPVSFAQALKADLALSVVLRVDAAPAKRVSLAMGDARPGAVDIASVLRAAAGKGWVKLRVRLSCMAKTGADLAAVGMPLTISTGGKLALGLHSARIEGGGGAGCATLAAP
jgi:beta-glucosidase